MESTHAHLKCAQLQHAMYAMGSMHAIGSMHAQLQHAMSASAHLQGSAEVWQLVASVVFPPEPAILALGVLFQAGIQVAVAGPEPAPVVGVLVKLPATCYLSHLITSPHITLSYTILYYIILYCIILFIILYYIISYHIRLYYTMLCYIILYDVVLCYIQFHDTVVYKIYIVFTNVL